MAEGKKHRKHGRAKRGGAMAVYNTLRRDLANKKRNIEKEKVWQSACKAVRSLAANRGEEVRDVCRQVRIARRTA